MLTAVTRVYLKPLEQREKQFWQNLLVAVCLCLVSAAFIAAQTSASAGSLALVRNVRVADEVSGELTSATVLVSGGKMTRVEPNTPLPADAVEIDGGGNILTLDADGRIILRSDLSGAVLQYEPKKQNDENALMLVANNLDRQRIRSDSTSISADTLRSKTDSTQLENGVSGSRRNDSFEEQANRQNQPSDNLAQKVVDPSAAISTISFSNKYVPTHWGIDDDENEFSVQAAIPYKLGGKQNIFRATIPFLTNTPVPGNNGIGDVALLNITLLPFKWGTVLVGPVVSLAANKGPGVDTFALGPSFGTVFKRGKWTYGFLNQNLFSFGGDVKTTQIQPILAYTVSEKVSLALGDDQFTLNWNRKKFVSAPLSGQINYIALFGKQPVRFYFNAQYNPINEFGARKWTLTPGMALILK